MELLEHIVLFFVSIGLMLLAWLIFLAINKYVSHMPRGLIQTILGTANNLLIIVALVGIFGYFSLSFSIGLMILIAVLIVRMIVKKVLASFKTPAQT